MTHSTSVTKGAERPRSATGTDARGHGDWPHLSAAGRRALAIWFGAGALMTFLVLVIGGITRLTQSGLSIVDWAPLMGVVPPIGEAQWQAAFDRYREFPEYQVLRRGMTLDEFRFIYFWEYLHRLAARTIGIVFLVPFVAFLARGMLDRRLLGRALLLFALGGMQGLMGWYMVMSGLVDQPFVSHYRLAAHLLLAFAIFGLCVAFALDMRPPAAGARDGRPGPVRSTTGLWVVGALIGVQVLWGAFVAGLKAGLVYPSFPLMGGSLVPPGILMLQPALLNLFDNPITVQWMHRVLGTALALAVAMVYARAWASGVDRASRWLGGGLVALIAAQYALGVLTVLHHVPVALAAAHQALALLLFGVWVAWLHHVRRLASGRIVGAGLPTKETS